MIDIVERLREWPHGHATMIVSEAIDEIERLRELLREVINSAWEMELEDRHTIDSDVIGKVAMAVLAFSSTDSNTSEIAKDRQ